MQPLPPPFVLPAAAGSTATSLDTTSLDSTIGDANTGNATLRHDALGNGTLGNGTPSAGSGAIASPGQMANSAQIADPAQAADQQFRTLDILGSSWALDQPANLLLVDSDPLSRGMLRTMLERGRYCITECASGEEAWQVLRQRSIQLVIIDYRLRGDISSLGFLRRMRFERQTELIPAVLITSTGSLREEVEGLEAGADDFLTRPIHPTLLKSRIDVLLRHKTAIDSLEEAESILFALAQTVESRDEATSAHCQRLATYGVSLGLTMGLPQRDLVALYRGGFLHDIGKVAVPDAILLGRRRLTPEEFEIVKRHTVVGEEICRPMKSLAPVLPIIRNHHERFDGSGYPDGLAGHSIPLLARILQVVDIFDALTSARPYKQAYSTQEALDILREESRRGWRDPEIVEVFCALQSNQDVDLGGIYDNDLRQGDSMSRSLEALAMHVE